MKTIATNKRASYDFVISSKLDAGLVLTGSEVKSLRNNSSSIKESFVEASDSELWFCNCFIKKYESSSEIDNNPTRKRKLLVNKKELNKIMGHIKRDGYSVIPIKMYFNDIKYDVINWKYYIKNHDTPGCLYSSENRT